MFRSLSLRVARAWPATGCGIWGTTFVLILAITGCASRTDVVELSESLPVPPQTRTDVVVDMLHGVEVPDPYRWLEDQESAETRAWIEAQNAYTDALLDSVPGRDGLRARFAELMEIDQIRVPTEAGGRYFFSQRRADQDLFVLSWRDGLDGEEHLLLDPHDWSEDHTTSFSLLDVARDGTLVVYGVREGGKDEVSIHLHDVDRRVDLEDTLTTGRYFGVSLTPDKKRFFYAIHTAEGPRLKEHVLGSDPADDREWFGDGLDESKILLGSVSEDGRYLLVHVLHGVSGDMVDVYLCDLTSDRGFETVVEGEAASFFGRVVNDEVVLRTTWQAPNGRVVSVSAASPGTEQWRELIPERKDEVLESVSAVGKQLFVRYLQEVQSRVVSFDLSGQELGEIAFDTIGTVGNVSGRWDGDEAFFVFTSFHMPTTIYRYDVASGDRTEWARPEVPINSDQFAVKQVWYESADGTKVSMFLVHAKDIELDGERPTLLTGYGGFNLSLTPRFSSSAVVWVEQGGVYAVANLRGGGELGEAWHEAGMLGNKQNVFDDFIAAGEWLIANGYTRPDKLAIEGGSNGGLLVGTVANQRPDLFGAVICSYPLLDMVRYHQFLVARYWVPEYGSSEDRDQFDYIHAYSPYHNVLDGGDYPAMLFVTGDGDTRVAPLHARKMAALVQAKNGSDNPILLRYHTKAGHSGGMPLSEQIDNSVESTAFLLWRLGEAL